MRTCHGRMRTHRWPPEGYDLVDVSLRRTRLLDSTAPPAAPCGLFYVVCLCIYVCVCIYMCIHIHIHICVYIHTDIYIYIERERDISKYALRADVFICKLLYSIYVYSYSSFIVHAVYMFV